MKYTLESRVSVMVGLTENNEIKIINNTYGNMDYLYIIKEAGELDYRGNKFNVEAGDIVVKLYKNNGSCDDREIVIIPAKFAAPWVKNVEESEARERDTSACSCSPKMVAQDEVPVFVEEIAEGDRGENGYGSTNEPTTEPVESIAEEVEELNN